MEKAYIILAHKNPKQLLKLISRLDDNQSVFFLHIDKQADITPFQPVFDYGEKVKLLDREATHWGGLGLVKATLNGLHAVQDCKSFDRIILLSGQDYPIKENDFINSFLKTADAQIFLEHTTIPDISRWKETGGMYRINKYYMGLKKHQKYLAKCLNLGLRFIPLLRRKSPEKMQYYAGSQWWILNSYAVNYILNYVKTNPDYTRFHKYTFAPDEVYFHTILLNSDDEKITKYISNNNLMYMKWLHSSSSHPELLQKEDVHDMISSANLFARKFEQENTSDVFDTIDYTLLKKSELQPID